MRRPNAQIDKVDRTSNMFVVRVDAEDEIDGPCVLRITEESYQC